MASFNDSKQVLCWAKTNSFPLAKKKQNKETKQNKTKQQKPKKTNKKCAQICVWFKMSHPATTDSLKHSKGLISKCWLHK